MCSMNFVCDRKIVMFVLLCSLSLLTVGFGQGVNNLNPVSLQPQPTGGFNTETTIPNRFNYFDLELLQEFGELQGNVFISPASIKTTLAMILEGAKGLTAQEIGNALRIDNMSDLSLRDVLSKLLFDLNDKSPNTNLQSSNRIFVSNKLKVKPEYRNTLEKYYKSDINSIDFNNPKFASAAINSWVSNATHGAIRELVNEGTITQDTHLLLANALYFKGKWQKAFDAKHTKPKCFHTLTKGCIDTPLMQIQDTFNYNYIEYLNAHAIELPYQEKYSMLILLPVNDNGIKILTKDIQHIRFTELVNSLQPNDLLLEIPKFQIEFSSHISPYLIPLKIRELFGPNANLSGIITSNERIKVDNIVHKTKIEVDEFGTVSAAASGVVIVPLMGNTAQPVIADHPFLFFIYNQQSKNIIFEGILMEPQGSPPNVVQPVQQLLRSRSMFVEPNLGYRNYQG